MSLAEKWLRLAGPGILGGVRAGDWLRLLARHRFRLSPRCLLRAASISCYAPCNSLAGLYESCRYRRQVECAEILPPVFILGHWRQGTTHLHNLLSIDPRFAYPTTFQCCFPHTFLSTETVSSRLMGPFFPPRRPMDNMEWSLSSPQEDEFALLIMTFCSPCMAWNFPEQKDRYRQYLTFRHSSAADVARWKDALINFLKKLTCKYGRPLLLKSPPHTARIRLLVELFPEARFVHIRRNPLEVFVSTRKTFQVCYGLHCLQAADHYDLDRTILEQYREMYDAYFEDRALIADGHLAEVSFEELQRDPIAQLRRIYERLRLPRFETVEPAVREYTASIAGYQKNSFQPLEEALQNRIFRHWHRNFKEWGYSNCVGATPARSC